jgi:ankyrin repeat protein
MSALFVYRTMESVKRLVAKGADVSEINLYSCTPLLRAAEFGHIPIMHWLLTEGGSNLAERDILGSNALLVAAPLGGSRFYSIHIDTCICTVEAPWGPLATVTSQRCSICSVSWMGEELR